VNQHVAIIRVDPHRADPGYVHSYLTHPAVKSYIESFNAGGSRRAITKGHIESFELALPPLKEQRAIAHILATLDDKIELNRRMNETLEAMARAIFKSWFVDFDPVRAKAEGRDPGLPKHIANLFPNRFEDSELGEIPVGWEVGKVENFATLNRVNINPGDFPDETFEHFSIPAFDESQIPKRELGVTIKSNKFLVPSHAILLSKLNPRIPRLWLPVVRDNLRAICSTEFLVVLPRIKAFRDFMYGLLSSEAFADVFETLVTGTSGSHQRVKPEGLLSMNVVLPDQSVIDHFSKVVQPLLARMDRAREESQTLAALRDTLLPKLISGELRIENADKFLEREI
jgi:type I restriction enzyme S subunit